jgi:hypothetical protein
MSAAHAVAAVIVTYVLFILALQSELIPESFLFNLGLSLGSPNNAGLL